MANFHELNEAAKILGVTPDELIEMRSAGEIHGYRDGASWKFKQEEVERVLAERGGSTGDADDSVLVTEESLGHSGETTSSTIIGKDGQAESADSDLSMSSDLTLESSGDLSISSETGSALELSAADSALDDAGVDSDVTLVPGAGSDVSLVPDPGSDKEIQGSAGTGDLPGSSGGLDAAELEELDDELALSDDDDLVLSSSGTGSGSDLSLSSADSGIDLSSPSDSGLSLEADSGISLQSPTDSGLSLEDDAIDMGGSSVSSLELPEDDPINLEDDADGVQKDEQFMLSPSDEMFADESDSGSQVIALEDSEAFDQDAMGDDALVADGIDPALGGLGGPGAAPAMAPAQGRPGELAEADYSLWNIMGLSVAILFLMLTGILMTDIVRNMWGWEEGRDVSTGISRGITSAIGF